MITVKIKPLSANEAWKGRRFKTDEYKTYEHSLHYLLPRKIELPPGILSFIPLAYLQRWQIGITA